jgi:hypothetical protein
LDTEPESVFIERFGVDNIKRKADIPSLHTTLPTHQLLHRKTAF